jgi:hypothetical protein
VSTSARTRSSSFFENVHKRVAELVEGDIELLTRHPADRWRGLHLHRRASGDRGGGNGAPVAAARLNRDGGLQTGDGVFRRSQQVNDLADLLRKHVPFRLYDAYAGDAAVMDPHMRRVPSTN